MEVGSSPALAITKALGSARQSVQRRESQEDTAEVQGRLASGVRYQTESGFACPVQGSVHRKRKTSNSSYQSREQGPPSGKCSPAALTRSPNSA